jgi:CubicO group peptidase (beta-lactamase class C family)
MLVRVIALSLVLAASTTGSASTVAGAAAPVTPEAVARDPRVVQALRLLEAWADTETVAKRLPGVSMAVVHDQQLLWSRGFGYAHLESKVAAGADTMYSICSISKLFTSVAVMQQRDAGKLNLDDPVAKHLPWFRIQGAQDGSPPVTVRGILTHSSGLPRESEFPYWTGPAYAFPSRDKMIERVGEQQMLYRSNLNYQYSNLGLSLAGEIAAATSGVPFAEYVRTRILDPIGLKDTETEHLDKHRGGRLATGYTAPRRDGSRERVPPYQVRGIAPAAGFTSTVEDLGRFASWQFRVLDGDGDAVLDSDTLREMQRVQWMDPDWKNSRGLGFGIWRAGEQTFVGHAGYCPGYQSQLLLQPASKVATVFMTNSNGIDSRAFAQVAYDIVAPAVKQALENPAGAKPHDPALARYTGRYDNWLAGESWVIPWNDGLAMFNSEQPSSRLVADLIKLRPVGEHRFRTIRDDGSLGEEVRFELAADGTPVRVWQHSNYEERPVGSKPTS